MHTCCSCICCSKLFDMLSSLACRPRTNFAIGAVENRIEKWMRCQHHPNSREIAWRSRFSGKICEVVLRKFWKFSWIYHRIQSKFSFLSISFIFIIVSIYSISLILNFSSDFFSRFLVKMFLNVKYFLKNNYNLIN